MRIPSEEDNKLVEKLKTLHYKLGICHAKIGDLMCIQIRLLWTSCIFSFHFSRGNHFGVLEKGLSQRLEAFGVICGYR